MSFKIKFFYFIKPITPRPVQISLRRIRARRYLHKHRDIWPINEDAKQLPKHWNGWPEGKRFSFVITHDVETSTGYRKVEKLVELESSFGFRSSFNFVPERYKVEKDTIKYLHKKTLRWGFMG